MLLVDMTNTEQMKPVDKERKGDIIVSPSKNNNQALVELKNGKVMFRQKALSCEKMSETMQEIVKFRAFLRQRAGENHPPLEAIPEEYTTLIAQLVHESDKSLTSLAKHIQKSLRPEELESSDGNSGDSMLVTQSALESAIVSVADRLNYGIDWTEKIAASLSIWKWEVKRSKLDLLPRLARDKFEARIAERQQAKKHLRSLFDALPQSERDSLSKAGRKAKNDAAIMNVHDENKDLGEKPEASEQGLAVTEENTESSKGQEKSRKDKILDPERAAKEKEKADKKAAKEERERKEQEAQTKSRSLMSAFLKKPKAINSKLLNSGQSFSRPAMKQDPSSSKTDFEKLFKPFVIKKDAIVAPINVFREREKYKNVIIIDDDAWDSPRKLGRKSMLNPEVTDPHDYLREFIANASPKLPRRHCDCRTAFKSSSAFCIRDIFSRLSEAEVLGDTAAVRNLHSLLACRAKIVAKVLIFHEDHRPGYLGTLTKSSATIGPRTPFAKDALSFDYGYDSGEEWEEEEEGADDVMSNDGDEVAESSEVGSDLEDWLVDDDDVVDPGAPLSERAPSPDILFPLPPTDLPKRKSAKTDERREPKKRKVMLLVPFNKGPCWENSIGSCDYEPFNQYRIKLFNDTPFPIDPFTFVSGPVVAERSSQSSSKRLENASEAPPAGSLTKIDVTSAVTGSATAGVKRKPAAALPPKNPFPEALLPYLAEKVESLASGNMIWLVETLFQDMKSHKIKKNAIDAKVREICEKCPNRRVWIIREDVMTSLGKQSTTVG